MATPTTPCGAALRQQALSRVPSPLHSCLPTAPCQSCCPPASRPRRRCCSAPAPRGRKWRNRAAARPCTCLRRGTATCLAPPPAGRRCWRRSSGAAPPRRCRCPACRAAPLPAPCRSPVRSCSQGREGVQWCHTGHGPGLQHRSRRHACLLVVGGRVAGAQGGVGPPGRAHRAAAGPVGLAHPQRLQPQPDLLQGVGEDLLALLVQEGAPADGGQRRARARRQRRLGCRRGGGSGVGDFRRAHSSNLRVTASHSLRDAAAGKPGRQGPLTPPPGHTHPCAAAAPPAARRSRSR